MRYLVVLLIAVPLLVTACSKVEAPDGKTQSARSEAQLTTVDLGGLTFEIPTGWVTYLSREQLSEVEQPERDEWDTEFAKACNAAIPFDRCVAHVGSEPWGENARSYGDLQVRVYRVTGDLNALEEQIIQATRTAVSPDELDRETTGGWRRILVRYRRHHFDYQATAVIDFRLKNIDNRHLVFVFMHTNYPNDITNEIPRILSSAQIAKR